VCGILGLIAPHNEPLKIPPQALTHALQLLKHRGPNHQQLLFFDSNQTPVLLENQHPPVANTVAELPPFTAALGHARLAIIDRTSHANQPMQRGPLWVVFNGEIYNHRDLRKTLESQGEHFDTQSDTEVLLALYARYGAEMLPQLNGMFAFAIWDTQQRTLFLARDRYGIKPLYYTRLNDSTFAFASEIKSLLALPGVDKTLNYTALSEHLTFQNTFQSRTLLQAIHCLEAGHWLQINPSENRMTPHRYWEPYFHSSPSISAQTPETTIKQMRDTLTQAIGSQLIGEVPIGSFLSGGLDSGAISAIASQRIPALHTFTAVFNLHSVSAEEALFDERQAARTLAETLHTTHHDFEISPDALSSCLPNVVWHLDDFRAGISYQNFLVSQSVQPVATVVLSGVGGDELLAGYPWRYAPILAQADHFQKNPQAFQEHYYQAWCRLLTEPEKAALFSPLVQQALGSFSTRDSFQEVFQNSQADHPLNQALCFDFKTFLHGLLIVEDRLSMAHSVESRVPFLDNALVDFCMQLPIAFKLHSPPGHAPPTSKWILRQALKGIVPDAFLTRPKQGFTPPGASWDRGPNRAYIEQILLSPHTLERGLFQPDALRRILEAHFQGQRNHRQLIWSLLCLEWWQRLFIDASILTPPTAF
jgi:asparagine synthase (glutamine-hydrolysing)